MLGLTWRPWPCGLLRKGRRLGLWAPVLSTCARVERAAGLLWPSLLERPLVPDPGVSGAIQDRVAEGWSLEGLLVIPEALLLHCHPRVPTQGQKFWKQSGDCRDVPAMSSTASTSVYGGVLCGHQDPVLPRLLSYL